MFNYLHKSIYKWYNIGRKGVVYMPKTAASKQMILDSLEGLSKRELQQIITESLKLKGFTDKSVARTINYELEEQLKELKINTPCPKCDSKIIVSNGRRENGIQRLKCTDCGKTVYLFYWNNVILR